MSPTRIEIILGCPVPFYQHLNIRCGFIDKYVSLQYVYKYVFFNLLGFIFFLHTFQMVLRKKNLSKKYFSLAKLFFNCLKYSETHFDLHEHKQNRSKNSIIGSFMVIFWSIVHLSPMCDYISIIMLLAFFYELKVWQHTLAHITNVLTVSEMLKIIFNSFSKCLRFFSTISEMLKILYNSF